MIKKFKEFDNINELKHSTYQSASSKLRRMGGIHKSRAENIDNWSYISLGKPFGTFNMHFDIGFCEFVLKMFISLYEV